MYLERGLVLVLLPVLVLVLLFALVLVLPPVLVFALLTPSHIDPRAGWPRRDERGGLRVELGDDLGSVLVIVTMWMLVVLVMTVLSAWMSVVLVMTMWMLVVLVMTVL